MGDWDLWGILSDTKEHPSRAWYVISNPFFHACRGNVQGDLSKTKLRG